MSNMIPGSPPFRRRDPQFGRNRLPWGSGNGHMFSRHTARVTGGHVVHADEIDDDLGDIPDNDDSALDDVNAVSTDSPMRGRDGGETLRDIPDNDDGWSDDDTPYDDVDSAIDEPPAASTPADDSTPFDMVSPQAEIDEETIPFDDNDTPVPPLQEPLENSYHEGLDVAEEYGDDGGFEFTPELSLTTDDDLPYDDVPDNVGDDIDTIDDYREDNDVVDGNSAPMSVPQSVSLNDFVNSINSDTGPGDESSTSEDREPEIDDYGDMSSPEDSVAGDMAYGDAILGGDDDEPYNENDDNVISAMDNSGIDSDGDNDIPDGDTISPDSSKELPLWRRLANTIHRRGIRLPLSAHRRSPNEFDENADDQPGEIGVDDGAKAPRRSSHSSRRRGWNRIANKPLRIGVKSLIPVALLVWIVVSMVWSPASSAEVSLPDDGHMRIDTFTYDEDSHRASAVIHNDGGVDADVSATLQVWAWSPTIAPNTWFHRRVVASCPSSGYVHIMMTKTAPVSAVCPASGARHVVTGELHG